MAMMKTGGKTTSGNSVPFKVTDSGEMNTVRSFRTELVTIYNKKVSNGDTTTNVVLGDYAQVSLRAFNYSNTAITLVLQDDRSNNSGLGMRLPDGTNPTIVIPANTNLMITVDDYPWLAWVYNLRFRVGADTTPNASTTIVALLKR